jgi:gliding motility-associated-like protein
VYTAPGTYIALLIVTNSDCGQQSDTTEIEVTVSPVAQLDLGEDIRRCDRAPVALDAGPGWTNVLWSTGDTTRTITATVEGNYTVTVTNEGGCSTIDSIGVINAPLFAIAVTGSNCEGIDFRLALPPGADRYTWSTGDSVSVIEVTEEGWYAVEVISGECTTRDSVLITGGEDRAGLYIPNSFTPNDDGINDLFRAIGSDITEFELRIFNRWGEEIRAMSDPAEAWDGRYGGEPVPVGVYTYRLAYATLCQPIGKRSTGHVAVIR